MIKEVEGCLEFLDFDAAALLLLVIWPDKILCKIDFRGFFQAKLDR